MTVLLRVGLSIVPYYEPHPPCVFLADNEPQSITTDNIGSYTIEDIVLPLPGYSVTYPHNEGQTSRFLTMFLTLCVGVVGQWYSELLAQDELCSEKLRCRVKDYSLSGSYRPLIIKPNETTWWGVLLCSCVCVTVCRSSIYYDDPKVQLLETDKDKLDDAAMSHPACGGYRGTRSNVVWLYNLQVITKLWLSTSHSQPVAMPPCC